MLYVYNKLGKYTANAVSMVNRTNLKGIWSSFSDYVDPIQQSANRQSSLGLSQSGEFLFSVRF